MRILVIDRDSLVAQLITTQLEGLGHQVVLEPSKNAALDLLKTQIFDVILIDPAPMRSPRNFIFSLWDMKPAVRPFVGYLSTEASQADAIMARANDLVAKPIDKSDLETKIENAQRLMTLHEVLNDGRFIESSGGIINKEAFNQLFLSGMHRAGTYGERSFIFFIYMENHDALYNAMGWSATDEILNKLSAFLSDMRRQSDVIARIDTAEFAVILQRPIYPEEPFDAANRFIEELTRFITGLDNPDQAPQLFLSMIELPLGALHVQSHIPEKRSG